MSKGGNKTSKNGTKEEHEMLVDRYKARDVFVRVPEVAEQTDQMLKALDRLLEDDRLYQQMRADLGNAIATRWCLGGIRRL